MQLVVFEDELWRNFIPLVQTRPLYDLRCGALTLRERLNAFVAVNQHADPPPTVTGLSRLHLLGCFGPPNGALSLLQHSAPLTLVNARAIDLHWLPELLRAPVGTVFVSDETLLGARLSPALLSAVFYYLLAHDAAAALAELQRFANVVTVDTRLLIYPWDLISLTGEQIVNDLPLLAWRLPRYTSSSSDILVRGEHVYVAPSARLDGPLVLDARDGPLFIDENAHIEPFSFLQGPLYVGAGSLIASARIRAETSIGPVCRVGGEVEASVVQGFSNKHHDGFLGHSWLGEWVNIGAMTTNSDLKNNYGNVRVVLEELGQIDSGIIKLGCFLADHVKIGIGVHLTGGTVIGPGSNIFGVHMAPKTVPSFIWGGEVFREYRINNMIDVARRVMSRRKQVLSAEYETMLRDVFTLTSPSRGDLAEDLPASQPALPIPREQTLAQAELQAIRAFEEPGMPQIAGRQ